MACADIAVRKMGAVHGGVPSAPGAYPNKQTGHLARSVTYTKATNGVASFGTNTPYGLWLEKGANPRARGGGFLTVPLTKKAKRSLIGVGGNVRALGLVLIKTKRAMFLGKRIGGKRSRTEFWFILKKSVRILPRPWLVRSWTENRQAVTARAMDAFRRKMAEQFRPKAAT